MSETPAGPPQSSFIVSLSGILLIVLGLLVGLVGLLVIIVGAFVRSAVQDAVNNGTLSGYGSDVISFVEGVLVVLGVIVLLYGLGELLAGIGVLRHRTWARVLGIVLALIAALFSTLGVLGSMRAEDARGGLVVLLVFAILYWFIVVALALGGRAFRHG